MDDPATGARPATGNEFLIASEACNLSMVERQLGDLDAAEALAREALEIEHADGRPVHDAVRDQRVWRRSPRSVGEFERAATLVGAAEAIMEAAVHGLAARAKRPHYERMLTRWPAAMGSDASRADPSSRVLDWRRA